MPPDGSVQAISTAAATILSLGLGFVGLWAWGPQSTRAWAWKDALVLLPFAVVIPSLAYVPWVATQSGGLESARYFYGVGCVALFIGVIITFIISITDREA